MFCGLKFFICVLCLELKTVLKFEMCENVNDSVIFLGEIQNTNTSTKLRPRHRKNKRIQNLTPTLIIDLTNQPDVVQSASTDISDDHNKENESQEKRNITLECPICLESLLNADVKVTQCGHIFCSKCLDKLKTMQKGPRKCPKCRKGMGRLNAVYF